MAGALLMIGVMVALLLIGMGRVIDNQRAIKKDLAKIKKILGVKEVKK